MPKKFAQPFPDASQLSYSHEIDAEIIDNVTRAGRAIIVPTTGHAAYLSSFALLTRLRVDTIFKPCNASLYGRSTPDAEYVEVRDAGFVPTKVSAQYNRS